MGCAECDRVRRYMSADPEMYRDEDHRCEAHKKLAEMAKDERVMGVLADEVRRRGLTIQAQCSTCGLYLVSQSLEELLEHKKHCHD